MERAPGHEVLEILCLEVAFLVGVQGLEGLNVAHEGGGGGGGCWCF